MKVGVLQFFSWSRRIPLTSVYERAFSRLFTEKVLPKLL